MDALAIFAPPESDRMRGLVRVHAYVCAALAGLALYLVATNASYSRLFAVAGPLWLILSIVLAVLASRDPDKRVDRLLGCVIICLGTFALASVIPGLRPFLPASTNLDMSTVAAVVIAVMNLIILIKLMMDTSIHIGHVLAVVVNLPVLLSIITSLLTFAGGAMLLAMNLLARG